MLSGVCLAGYVERGMFQLTSVPVLSDAAVILFSSIVVDSKWQFLVCATAACSERYRPQ